MIVDTSGEGEIVVFASDYFDMLPFPMQYGVYLDFFDSVGIEIFVKGLFLPESGQKSYHFTMTNYWMTHLNNHLENRTKTRLEAQNKSIEKSNEFYNNL
ncbi:hypothetical protein [Tenacibaculum dicentrarchi]|uniref:hypothetical protein n=1 Tax=Tenacibaculum dicentrarchi TaxID=669041 RepID=UPI00351646C3